MSEVNITWNGRPTRIWLRHRSWGRQYVRRAAGHHHPFWLARLRLARAEWVCRAKDVRKHLAEVDAVLIPAFTALIDRLDAVKPKSLPEERTA